MLGFRFEILIPCIGIFVLVIHLLIFPSSVLSSSILNMFYIEPGKLNLVRYSISGFL